MNYKVIVLMVLCIAVVAAAGCTAGNNSGVSQKSVVSPQAAYDYSGISASRASGDSIFIGEEGLAEAPVPAATPGSGTTIETRIIKTGYITIEVKDVTASVDALKNMVTAKGGYLSSSSISEGYNKRLTGTVVLRIPQAEFDTTLAGVKAIGTVKSVSTRGEDVTEEYVDLEAQKTSYLNQLAQYNAIMKKAINVSDVIEIQQQIDRVQIKLNQLEGRMRYLNSRLDLSTITVTLQEPEPVGGDTGYDFITTINEAINGFIGSIKAIIVLFAALIPWLIVLGIIGYVINLLIKRNRTSAKAPAEPAEKKITEQAEKK
ncbi:MAG: DUF4349 domain-containing protein [Methanoregula sp.]|jgi:hypothetical protein